MACIQGLPLCVLPLCFCVKGGSDKRKIILNWHTLCRKSITLVLHSGVSRMPQKWTKREMCEQCWLPIYTTGVCLIGDVCVSTRCNYLHISLKS